MTFAPAHFRDFLDLFPQFILTIPEVLPVVTFPCFVGKTLQYGICSICYNGVSIWNKIPSEVRNSTSIKGFGKKF